AKGYPVVDLEAERSFVAEDFIDTTHLEEEFGRPRLSVRLAAPDVTAIGGVTPLPAFGHPPPRGGGGLEQPALPPRGGGCPVGGRGVTPLTSVRVDERAG